MYFSLIEVTSTTRTFQNYVNLGRTQHHKGVVRGAVKFDNLAQLLYSSKCSKERNTYTGGT